MARDHQDVNGLPHRAGKAVASNSNKPRARPAWPGAAHFCSWPSRAPVATHNTEVFVFGHRFGESGAPLNLKAGAGPPGCCHVSGDSAPSLSEKDLAYAS